MNSQRTFLSNQTNVLNPPHWKSRAPLVPVDVQPKGQLFEYSAEIFSFFLEMEKNLYSSRLYMERQPEITDKMRKILVDWLADVMGEYKLHPETYFLAVDIIDRFLAIRAIPRAHLQLVGITAILIAAKHEEVWPLSVNDCVTVTANTYHARDVIDMERDIATLLNFKFTVPTIYPIVSRYIEIANSSPLARNAIHLFLESSVHCYTLLKYLPSQIAAACFASGNILAFYNSQNYVGGSIQINLFWGTELTMITKGIRADELKPIIDELLFCTQRLCSASSKLQAVQRKYMSPKYQSVAALNFPPSAIIS